MPRPQSDIARYEILLQVGGVYIDTDFECLRNVEPLIDGIECFAAQERDAVFENGLNPVSMEV
jgi:inositol phosphorylceramide mannosyltransferase catalytic subunit